MTSRPAATLQAGRARRGLVRGMVGLCAVIVAVSPGWSVVSTLGLAFHTQLGVSELGIGLVAALVSLGYVGAGIPVGRVIDRSGGRVLFAVAPGLLAVLFVGLVLIARPWALAVVALLAGAVWAGCVAGTNRSTVLLAPPDRRGIMVGIIQATTMLVSGAAAAVLPRVAQWWGWRHAVLLLVGVALVAGATSLVALSGRHRVPRPPPDQQPERSRIRFPGRFWALLGFGVVIGSAMHCVWTFLLIFLDATGVSTSLASIALAGLFVFGGVGRLLWGLVLDRGVNLWLLLTLSALGGAGAVLTLNLGLGGGWLVGCVIGVGLLLLGHSTMYVLAGMRMTPITGWAVAGAALTSAHVVGGMAGPPLFALIVERGGGYGPAWAAVAGSMVLSLPALWLASRGDREA